MVHIFIRDVHLLTNSKFLVIKIVLENILE